MLSTRGVREDAVDIENDRACLVRPASIASASFRVSSSSLISSCWIFNARVGVMSARLDPVALVERLTLPVPYGHHVYVVSDLSLSPRHRAWTSRPVREFISTPGRH